MASYKLIVKNAKVILKTVTNAVLNITGIKDLLTGNGSVDSNTKIDWTLQHYTNTAANFNSTNPILLVGQLGIETDGLTTTPKYKIGDGVTAWNTLPYNSSGGSGLSGLTTNKVLKATSSTTVGNSNITDDGTIVIIESPNSLNSIYVSNAISGYGYGSNESGGVDTNDSRTNVTHTIKNTFDAPLHEFNNSMTKNGVEVATVNDIPSVAGLEQTLNKSSSYTASSTTTYANTEALVNGLATKAGNLIAKQNTTISHTGTTAETKIYSVLIPAGTFQANDIFNLMMKAYGATGVGSKNFKVYINTSDAVGGVQIALLTVAAVSVTGIFERNMFFKNSLSSQQILFATTSFVNEYTQTANTGSYSNLTIDFTQLQYLVISCTLATAGDTAQILGLTGKIKR